MAEITREQIEELRGLLTRATRGPWERQTLEPTTLGYEWIDAPSGRYVAICRGLLKKDKGGHAILSPELDEITANTALIAAMRNALPALLDIAETAIRRLEPKNNEENAGPHEAQLEPGWLARDVAVAAARIQPKGGDADVAGISRNATSPGVTAGASEIEELCKRLEIKADMIQLGETIAYGSDSEIMREAATLIRRLVAERDNARSECAWLAKLLIRLREALNNIADGAEDEGDRVYFGSTNDADWLKEIACEVDSYAFDRITRKVKWPDYIEASAKANARATAAEAEGASSF